MPYNNEYKEETSYSKEEWNTLSLEEQKVELEIVYKEINAAKAVAEQFSKMVNERRRLEIIQQNPNIKTLQ